MVRESLVDISTAFPQSTRAHLQCFDASYTTIGGSSGSGIIGTSECVGGGNDCSVIAHGVYDMDDANNAGAVTAKTPMSISCFADLGPASGALNAFIRDRPVHRASRGLPSRAVHRESAPHAAGRWVEHRARRYERRLARNGVRRPARIKAHRPGPRAVACGCCTKSRPAADGTLEGLTSTDPARSALAFAS